VQALHGHLGGEDGEGDGEGGERHILQAAAWDGELRNVHLLQDQDMFSIGFERFCCRSRRREVFDVQGLGFK